MSSVQFAPRRTFFTVRRDGVRELGAEWPEGAIYRPRPDQHALQYDGGGVRVVRTNHQADVLKQALDAVARGKNPRARVGVEAGRFGDLPIYEEVARYLKSGAEPQARELPANVKEVHLKISKVTGSEIEGLANTPNVDRGFDRVEPSAFAEFLPKFMENPLLLFNHDDFWPIGKVLAVEVRPEGLWCKAQVDDEKVRQWVAEKRVRAFSVRFILHGNRFEPNARAKDNADPEARKQPSEIRVVTKAELLEISVVTIPMNRESLFSVSKGLDDGSDLVCRGCARAGIACDCDRGSRAVAYRRTPVSVPSTPFRFDAREVVKTFGAAGLRQSCAWTDGEDPLDGSRVLFPHHQLDDDEIRLNQEGLRLSMAKLLAADEDVPEDDRVAAYAHLAEHYRELGEEPPEFDKVPTPEKFASVALPAGKERLVALGFSADRFADLAKADAWRAARGFKPAKAGKTQDVIGTTNQVLRFVDDVPSADQCRTLELAPGVTALLSAASKQEPPVNPALTKSATDEPDPKKKEPAASAETEEAAVEEVELPASVIADMEQAVADAAAGKPVDLDRAERVYDALSQDDESS